MADVEKLLAEFAEELRNAGEADPRPYLRQVEGAERRELAALIDACIENAPRRAWDADAYRGSPSERAVERLQGVVEPSGESLRRLRDERKLKRSELTSRLADALGFADREPKVAHYYHQLEQGLLSTTGVSSRVFDALGAILGESVARVRAAAGGIAESAASDASQGAFARMSAPAPELEAADADRSPAPAKEEWDEVDELFRGGG
jgi:hypothetical protein